jgi:hypothetical protein
VGRALSFAFGMFWEILWALVLGFFLSGAVQAVVRKSEMEDREDDDNIYRKYYGMRMAAFIAGLVVDLIFKAVGLERTARDAKVVEAQVHWNYTTVLNILFLALAALLVYRFVRTGGIAMMRMMNRPMAHG